MTSTFKAFSNNSEELLNRAASVLQQCDQLKVAHFGIINAAQIVSGHPKLNVALIATIFNARPSLPALTEDETEQLEKAGLLEDDLASAAGDDREERAFRMWMNSSGMERFVHNLFSDCRDGLVLLQVIHIRIGIVITEPRDVAVRNGFSSRCQQIIDHIKPGSVDWRSVEMRPNNKFKMFSNTNYAVKLAKSNLNCSLVGIQGADITDGNRKPILSLTWQLMRYHTIHFLQVRAFIPCLRLPWC